jgi:hypothetical protein
MNQARVDDLLIEMITPKIKEIEQKFSQGQGLTQDDINTLLLKSQYNHINHLDDKLNEVTLSVQTLESKFVTLENKLELLKVDLESKFLRLETTVTQKLDTFAALLATQAAATDTKIERAINVNMRWSIGLIALLVIALKLADLLLA